MDLNEIQSRIETLEYRLDQHKQQINIILRYINDPARKANKDNTDWKDVIANSR